MTQKIIMEKKPLKLGFLKYKIKITLKIENKYVKLVVNSQFIKWVRQFAVRIDKE